MTDLGFPERGGANPPVGTPNIRFCQIFRKMGEWVCPLDPPILEATDYKPSYSAISGAIVFEKMKLYKNLYVDILC